MEHDVAKIPTARVYGGETQKKKSYTFFHAITYLENLRLQSQNLQRGVFVEKAGVFKRS